MEISGSNCPALGTGKASITTIQPVGPYVLFGWSAGGPLIFEVAAALEKQGCQVKDIILLDSFWMGDRPGDLEKEILRLPLIEKPMEELGLEFIKDRVKEKIESYLKYIFSLARPAVIDTNVHLILSEDERQEGIEFKWREFTSQPLTIYQGFGGHHYMLYGVPLEKNVQLIRDILEKSKV
ncbi:MAG: hypothetical protein GY940_10390 [bacterium]|nr:hypothetical protein [bacterium]